MAPPISLIFVAASLSVCEYKHLWDTKGMRPSQKSAQYCDLLDQKVMWGISCLWWLHVSKSEELHQFHRRRPSLSQQKPSDIHLPIWVCQNNKGVNPPWTNLFLLNYDVMVLKVFLHDGIIPASDAHTKPLSGNKPGSIHWMMFMVHGSWFTFYIDMIFIIQVATSPLGFDQTARNVDKTISWHVFGKYKKGRRMGEGWKPPWNVYFLHSVFFNCRILDEEGTPSIIMFSKVKSANSMMANMEFKLSWILQHQVLLPAKLAWTRYRFHLHANQQQRFQGPPAKPRWCYLSNLKGQGAKFCHG